MSDTALPTLFLSHGSPMWALEPGASGPALTRWGQALGDQLAARGTPLKGVVLMSPHWMARQPAVMSSARPATWHDFGGFPEPLYRLQYPAPGAPELAQDVLQRLQDAGLPVVADPKRPLDHGAWVPLMHLFPQADVPVVQVALPASAGPREVFAMGQALADLREAGVLVIGSGSMTHNLGEFFNGRPELNDPPAAYANEFSRWIEDVVARGDVDALLNYRTRAPHAVHAHPTEEHFLPIFFALGAAGWGGDVAVKPDYLTREIMYRYLAMDAFTLQ
ncbi:DODA-type extradiol aromatic ring-opening family dioxygenase [Hydrogenophaga sp. OTU3427]|uniref:DODA-type extradiol aromatic ring-opening family dioxygenase n=1 Tax=Hydrogenophaga sp. OTU3427 TaxID=3043856 RepID=UPI00313BCD9E